MIYHYCDPCVTATHAMITSMVDRPFLGDFTFYEHIILSHPSALEAYDGTIIYLILDALYSAVSPCSHAIVCTHQILSLVPGLVSQDLAAFGAHGTWVHGFGLCSL